MKKIKWLTAMFVAVLMLLAFTACGSSQQEEEAVEEETASAESLAEQYTNDGLVLSVPGAYNDIVVVDTPQKDKEGILFKVSEKASIEAAEAMEDGDVDGAGWLFSIGRVDEKTLHEMLCSEMSGSEAFAKDGDGNYYIFYHPTDVRLIRADNKEMDAAMDDWTALNEWASAVPASFITENNLTEERYGNSDLEMALNQIAYQDDVKYTISTTEFGPLEPGDVDPKPYVEKLTKGVKYEVLDEAEAPDGEYVVLNFPENKVRYDFFVGDETLIRQVSGDEENEQFYKATFEDDSITSTRGMQEWYQELAKNRQ